jgi:ubiquinol-cytochrome c reductase iron-sulfur subunit
MSNAERIVAALFVIALLAAVGLGVVYVNGGQPQLEGALLATALGGLGIGLLVWAKRLFPEDHITQDRPTLSSTDDERAEFLGRFEEGEHQIGRRRLLSRLLALAGGAFGVALLFPIRSLGPTPGQSLRRTSWYEGARLVAPGSDQPLTVRDIAVGGVVTVFPEGKEPEEDAATIVVRVEPDLLDLPEDRQDWAPEGFVAYSKVCTHVGCPVGLYEEETHRLVCPCHQSTFDVLRGADPVAGPAVLPLPQLPLAVTEDGELYARGDYEEPVGPSFWNRDRD